MEQSPINSAAAPGRHNAETRQEQMAFCSGVILVADRQDWALAAVPWRAWAFWRCLEDSVPDENWVMEMSEAEDFEEEEVLEAAVTAPLAEPEVVLAVEPPLPEPDPVAVPLELKVPLTVLENTFPLIDIF